MGEGEIGGWMSSSVQNEHSNTCKLENNYSSWRREFMFKKMREKAVYVR